MASQIGMGGNIIIATTTIPVATWTIAAKNDVQDVTSTNDAGWQDVIAGVSSADLTFTAYWGKPAALLSTTCAIGTTVTFTGTYGTTTAATNGTFIISDFTIKNDAKTPITFECSAKSKGIVLFT